MVWALVAGEVAGQGRWLWRLSGPDGFLAGYFQVEVDTTCWEWGALLDLPGRTASQADPADRLGSEARLVSEVGQWASAHVLGPLATTLAELAPVEVELSVPAGEERLLALPLGVAEVGGRSLAARRVVFAGATEGERAHTKEPVAGRLRALAVFSVPAGGVLLDLRRERKGLADLAGELFGAAKGAVELKVLQYGATKKALQEALDEGEGWDIVHFSGHGAPGRLVLEDEAGRPEVVPTEDLVEWLHDARRRIKLVVLSACSSAEFTVAQTLLSIGVGAPDVASSQSVDPHYQALAQEVSQQAQCAVVAMRYSVVDDFAIDFSLSLFKALWEKHMALAEAVGWSVRQCAPVPPTPGAPALSAYTPVLLGPGALDLSLVPPVPEAGHAPGTKMAGFREERERFVGRVAVMTRAHAAMAKRSGQSGVLFHGMAGAGKSSCALELAYAQEANFAELVFFECPPEGASGAEVSDALAKFAARLDSVLGVALVDKAHDPARLAEALPRLTEVMEKRAVLVVLDNAESLLSSQGHWLDPAWGDLLGALAAHAGLGRLVITSRRPPEPPLAGLAVEAVHALSRDEAVLLVRRLPHLAGLLQPAAATRGGLALARQVLELTGGHPKLLELADAHAERPEVLSAMLAGAGARWRQAGVGTASFLSTGALEGDLVGAYVGLLEDWAATALATLDEPALLLMQFICHCEGPDRTSEVVKVNWADTWHRLGRADPVPAHEGLLAALSSAALVEAQAQGDAQSYSVHPAVAATVASATPEEVDEAVDKELAAYWAVFTRRALDKEQKGEPTTELVAYAARRAAAYQARLGEWGAVQGYLEQAIARDKSPATLAEAIPLLRRAAAELAGTDNELGALGVLAGALRSVDPDEAGPLLRQVEERAVAAGNHRLASAVAGDLANLLTVAGLYQEAVEVLGRKAAHTKAAGLGPWTQLADKGRVLQVRQLRGEDEAVLAEVGRLCEEMAALPDPPGDNEPVRPWNVRETLCHTARSAAQSLERWDDALEWLDRVLQSKVGHGATALEMAAARFNAYGPLIRKGELGRARALLDDCRAVFEHEQAYGYLAQCLGATADLEDNLGHTAQAIGLGRMALRFSYKEQAPRSVAVSHYNLGNYLYKSGDRRAAAAHRLAAVVLEAVSGHGDYGEDVVSLARRVAAGNPVPATFEELSGTVEEVEGARFGQLVAALGADGEAVLAKVLADARAVTPEQAYANAVAFFEPTLALLVGAAGGNAHALVLLGERLDELSGQANWSALAGRLGRARDGERDVAELAEGLDATDIFILTRALDALAGRARLGPVPETLRPLAALVVKAAAHHRSAGAPGLSAEDEDFLSSELDDLAAREQWSALAAQLRRAAAGEEGPDWEGLDRLGTAVLLSVLARAEEGA